MYGPSDNDVFHDWSAFSLFQWLFRWDFGFSYSARNVIYMIICNHRFKQNLGETKWRLKHRFHEHRRPVYNPSNISKPTTVSEHFLTNDHAANDITRIPLEIVKSNRDSVRKARKTHFTERNGWGSYLKRCLQALPASLFSEKECTLLSIELLFRKKGFKGIFWLLLKSILRLRRRLLTWSLTFQTTVGTQLRKWTGLQKPTY